MHETFLRLHLNRNLSEQKKDGNIYSGRESFGAKLCLTYLKQQETQCDNQIDARNESIIQQIFNMINKVVIYSYDPSST